LKFLVLTMSEISWSPYKVEVVEVLFLDIVWKNLFKGVLIANQGSPSRYLRSAENSSQDRPKISSRFQMINIDYKVLLESYST